MAAPAHRDYDTQHPQGHWRQFQNAVLTTIDHEWRPRGLGHPISVMPHRLDRRILHHSQFVKNIQRPGSLPHNC